MGTVARELSLQELEAKFFSVLYQVEAKLWEEYQDMVMFDEEYEELMEECDVKINSRLRSSSGRYVVTNKDEVWVEVHPELRLRSLEGTLEHEALHLLTGLGDTKQFKRICNDLGIETNHSEDFSTMRKNKYKVVCIGCEEVIAKRKRKSKVTKAPDRYRSGCCQSGLKIETI